MSGTEGAPPTLGSLSLAISNAFVRLLAEYTGRGPTKVRTYINDDLITVVLRETMTKGERSLVRNGKVDLVLSTRKAYQQTMRDDLIAEVEQITGRTVFAFLSDNHADPDIAIESFVLVPSDGDARDAPQP